MINIMRKNKRKLRNEHLKKVKTFSTDYHILAHIFLPTELHLKSVKYYYIACSNPTNVVLVIVLSMIISKGAR